MRRAWRAGLVLGMTVVTAAPRALGAQEAGHVQRLAGPPGAVVRRHGGAPAPLRLLEALAPGDTLVATGPGRAHVRLASGRALWVCAQAGPGCDAGSPWAVPGAGRAPSPVVLAVRQVGAWLAAVMGRDSSGRTVQAVLARGGGPLRLPLVEGGEARLVAGRRDLALAWTGGTSPVLARLVRAGGAADTLVGAPLTDSTARWAGVRLLPGEYRLELRDADGRTLRARVVVEAALPRSAREARRAGGEDGVLWEALALAGEDEGRWAWEAWQRLAAREAEPDVAALRAALARGERPGR